MAKQDSVEDGQKATASTKGGTPTMKKDQSDPKDIHKKTSPQASRKRGNTRTNVPEDDPVDANLESPTSKRTKTSEARTSPSSHESKYNESPCWAQDSGSAGQVWESFARRPWSPKSYILNT